MALVLYQDLLNLREINLNRRRPTEDLHREAKPALCIIDLINGSIEGCERSGNNLDLLTLLEILLRTEYLLLWHLTCTAEYITMLTRSKRLRRILSRLICCQEASHTLDSCNLSSDSTPRVLRQIKLNKDVAGDDLLHLHLLLTLVIDNSNLLHRNTYTGAVCSELTIRSTELIDDSLYLLLISRVCMYPYICLR